MSGSLLLDTNAAIAIIAESKEIGATLDQAETAYLPATALGELYHGAYNSSRTTSNLRALARLSETFSVLPTTDETADQYGRVKTSLKAIGRPIPENDIWIAAIALQHNLQLLSRDAHFDAVDGLTRVSW